MAEIELTELGFLFSPLVSKTSKAEATELSFLFSPLVSVFGVFFLLFRAPPFLIIFPVFVFSASLMGGGVRGLVVGGSIVGG